MGALPRLKKKTELNYRVGSTNESTNCRYCVHLVDSFLCGNKIESRCKILGLQESVRYRVRKDYRCDDQEYNR